MHSFNPTLIHQNIKLENILIDYGGNYLLTDLGIVAKVCNYESKSQNSAITIDTPLFYMAPECFIGKSKLIMPADDIWSMGAMMYELITGTPPFGNYGGVLQKNGAEIPIIEENYSQELKDLIYSMLTKEPWNRPTAEMIEKYAYNKLNGIETDVLSAYNKLNRKEQKCQINVTNVTFGCAINDGRNITSAHSNNTVSSREKEGLFHSSLKKIKDFFLSKGQKTYNSFVPSSISEGDCVLSSIFAPAEIRRKSHLIVQVYLHLLEETEKVISLAQEVQKGAERRDYIPLQCKLSVGDKVEVLLNIYGETLLFSEKKRVVWRGSFTKCSFNYFVPTNIELDELSCMALLTVNEVPVGEMRFITKIVNAPRKLNTEIIAHKYSKVFISYSHQDESKVKFLHEGLELGSVPHFFDRKYLKAGDVFPQVIREYINSADLFILCWSENASKSEYVQKERLQALERAFPQVQPEKAAKLRIYPICIEPRVELPGDMKNYYHFGEI
jgi:serine/threonine protein kinase